MQKIQSDSTEEDEGGCEKPQLTSVIEVGIKGKGTIRSKMKETTTKSLIAIQVEELVFKVFVQSELDTAWPKEEDEKVWDPEGLELVVLVYADDNAILTSFPVGALAAVEKLAEEFEKVSG
ncbi:hypothetical protein NDU88_003581 [Pleurodeles waltl]|uniref:Uncharacterized protein n=1 Tax=Pleurodeles waltl TaxID=8319 RepID=A0AAV7W5Q6_PLEWA|nr:hypothetical protein NDU88_003581 [Pleurodeles waltl]